MATRKPTTTKTTTTRTPRAKKDETVAPKATAPKLKVKGKTAKEIATEKGEPYVNILSVELDPSDVGNGAFELDWNDKFIIQLVKAGYQAQPNEAENVIVDRWFQTVCRNILQENFEQWEANQPQGRTSMREDLGGGKTGVS
jgi:hypothetical protein